MKLFSKNLSATPSDLTPAVPACGLRSTLTSLNYKKSLRHALVFSLATFLSLASCHSLDAQGPDYSKVNDFLNGRRTLLQNQDLAIGGLIAPVTGNSEVKDSDVYILPQIVPGTQGLIAAKFFNLPYQVLVSELNNTITVEDPVKKEVYTLTLDGFPGDPKYKEFSVASAAVGDFNG